MATRPADEDKAVAAKHAYNVNERDICSKFITPAILKAGWDLTPRSAKKSANRPVAVVALVAHAIKKQTPLLPQIRDVLLERLRTFLLARTLGAGQV